MKFTLLILGTLFSMQLSAGVYNCTDASGKKIYRSQPCVEGQNKVELNVKTGSSTDLNQQENQQALSQQEQEAKDAQKKQEEEQAQQKLAQFKTKRFG